MVTTPLGIAIHKIVNQPQNPQILAADFSNSALVKARFFAPLVTSWNTSLCGTYNQPNDIKSHWKTRTIFVADTLNHRIVRLNPSHGDPSSPPQNWSCCSWGGKGSGRGRFNGPVALAIENKSGDIYVSDKGNNRIQKFTFDGDFILEFDSLWSSGMATDLDNMVYVSVPTLNKVLKFTPDFITIPEWNPPHHAFQDPIGLAVDHKNDVYVVNRGSREVKKFSKEGAPLLSWDGSQSGQQFLFPYGITYDFNINRIFVSDRDQHRIVVFNEDGSYVHQLPV